jgi:glutathione synthase
VHVGGSATLAEVSEADEKIIETIAPRLAADRLFFVGLDVIGGKLIEVNVTSPTLIQQMSRLTGRNLSALVIDRLEEKVRAY